MTKAAYALARQLPDRERYGLRSQIERAAVSVAANIAEGLGRGTQGDLERSLRIAAGSAAELRVLIDLANDLHTLTEPVVASTSEHPESTRRMLARLVKVVHDNRR